MNTEIGPDLLERRHAVPTSVIADLTGGAGRPRDDIARGCLGADPTWGRVRGTSSADATASVRSIARLSAAPDSGARNAPLVGQVVRCGGHRVRRTPRSVLDTKHDATCSVAHCANPA